MLNTIAPAFKNMDIYHMKDSMIQIASDFDVDLYTFVSFIGLLLSIHFILSKVFAIDDKAVWFFLHFVGNMVVMYFAIIGGIRFFTEPIFHLTHTVPFFATHIYGVSLHLYHVLFFKLNRDDIFHHFTFVFIASFLVYVFPPGHAIAIYHFFACGLPGGIDYLLLFLVKIGKVEKLTRLRAAMFLNVWIRAPGSCVSAAFALLQLSIKGLSLYEICRFLALAFLSMGNGQYYMQQVVYANGVAKTLGKVDVEKEKKEMKDD